MKKERISLEQLDLAPSLSLTTKGILFYLVTQSRLHPLITTSLEVIYGQENDGENSLATAVIKVVWTKIRGQIKSEITTLELIHSLKLQPRQIPNSPTVDPELTHSKSQAHPLSKTPPHISGAHPRCIPELTDVKYRAHPVSEAKRICD
ncbi:Uncharacterized protein Rs2_02942 [Raphanus sativus]|nr:Uncharacterized protein Rs2_02942 [Raphanus sativus]